MQGNCCTPALPTASLLTPTTLTTSHHTQPPPVLPAAPGAFVPDLSYPVLQAGAGADRLASEFSAHLNQLSLKMPLQHRRPSPLDPPTAAVAAQLDALQINDWPEPDAGGLHPKRAAGLRCIVLAIA
jgi:hypothetical protein